MYPGVLCLTRHGGAIGHSHSPPVVVDPFGTGGHGDPNRGTMPGETSHQYVTVDFPSLFPLLPFSCGLYLLLFVFTPFPSFSFGVPYLLPLFWEWPSPKKQPHRGGPHI